MLIQYCGFDSSVHSRIYSFNVIDPPRATRKFSVEVQSEEFGVDRLKFQDGPAISSERLERELNLETQGFHADQRLSVSERDVLDYRALHYPRKTGTSTLKRTLPVREEIFTLLLHELGGPLDALKSALEAQSIRVRCLRNCQDALPLLTGANPPHLVFTQPSLPDGSWTDIVGLATKASKPVNVIVVDRLANEQLYLQTVREGAFDFIVAPLSGYELTHVLRRAVGNVLGRREAQATPA